MNTGLGREHSSQTSSAGPAAAIPASSCPGNGEIWFEFNMQASPHQQATRRYPGIGEIQKVKNKTFGRRV
ncbi:hypothetical protein AC579_7446 [Pseudocercospora musae]|uniref:Uncharacterized protein n=1 Tax=Pseudocercospora musae TaxID=113226 RepID=A0A139IQA9_9PEZI|nr:hypothetical protein AC579_7446 [Pseudocercospora musae]